MMNAFEHFKRAILLRNKCADHLVHVSRAVREKLQQDNADVFYQNSDGWVILFDDQKGMDDANAPVSLQELAEFLDLSRMDALKFLCERSV